MALAAYLNPGGDLAAAVDCVKLAETLGYDSAWVTHGLGRDSFLVLAAYAAATSRIGLGNGVVPVYPRHPVAMAQAALTLNELAGGRFRLGIGVSHQAMMSGMLGLGVVEPLTVMREYVAVLRGALSGAAAFEGKYYRAHWSLALPTRPPALADLPGRARTQDVRAGRRDRRRRNSVAVPARLRAGRGAPGDRARTLASGQDAGRLRDRLCGPAGRDRRSHRRAGGVSHRADALHRPAVLPHHDGGRWPARGARAPTTAIPAVPESMATTLGGIGDAATARAYLESYRRAGVTLPAVRPITFPDAPWYRRTLEEAARW